LSRNNIDKIILLILLFLSPFVQSDNTDSYYADIIVVIPNWVAIFSSFIRWLIFVYILVRVIQKYSRCSSYFTKYNFLFSLFYFVPLIYSIITFTEVLRHFGLFLFSLVLPLFLTMVLDLNKQVFKQIGWIVIFLVFINYYVSFGLISLGYRFQGALVNPNLYSVLALFWLLLLLSKDIVSILDSVVILLLSGSIIFSGSRNGLIGLIIILLFYVFNKMNIKLIIFIVLFIFLSNTYFSDYYSRYTDMMNLIDSSGRGEIWELASRYISLNFFLGNGLDSPEILLGTGNVHNSYVRYLLTMGVPIGAFAISILMFFLFFQICDNHLNRNKPLGIFFLIFLVSSFGEDFFVGFGSSIFICINLTIAYISLEEKNNQT
jgi:hypothetical protein